MKHNGFTLIEMLGVFTVLAIIMVVSLPSITKNLKQNDINEYKAFVKNTELGAETYIEANRDKYPTLNAVGGVANVTIGTLKSENLITEVVQKPDGSSITDAMVVKVTVNADMTFKYEFIG